MQLSGFYNSFYLILNCNTILLIVNSILSYMFIDYKTEFLPIKDKSYAFIFSTTKQKFQHVI